MKFFSKTVAERTAPGMRQSVEEQNYVFHAHMRHDNLCGIIICDKEYPQRVAFSLITKSIEDLCKAHSKDVYTKTTVPLSFPLLQQHLTKYQNPQEADALSKVQKDLDETKIILHKTIEGVLDRGEKLENIVERTNDLSAQSKLFYKNAAKTNSCCVLQ
eukprot:Opistho-1_new@55135